MNWFFRDKAVSLSKSKTTPLSHITRRAQDQAKPNLSLQAPLHRTREGPPAPWPPSTAPRTYLCTYQFTRWVKVLAAITSADQARSYLLSCCRCHYRYPGSRSLPLSLPPHSSPWLLPLVFLFPLVFPHTTNPFHSSSTTTGKTNPYRRRRDDQTLSLSATPRRGDDFSPRPFAN